jgi:hypothetical protein
MNAAMSKTEDAEEDRMVNVVMQCSNKVWKTPDLDGSTWRQWKKGKFSARTWFVPIIMLMMEQRRNVWNILAWRRNTSYSS